MDEERQCIEPCPFDPPKCCRQRRSNVHRPPPRQGSLIEISSCKDVSLCTSTASMIEANQGHQPTPKETEFCMARCNMSSAGPSISNSMEIEPAQIESIDRNASIDSSNNGENGHLNEHTCSVSPAEPITFSLELKGGSHAWLAPGSLVWARIASHQWWPAEVMDEKRILQITGDQSNEGLVLVQLYGSFEYAWLDPVRRLARFDHLYEERSNNPLKAFQDALKQALHRKEDASSSGQSDKSSEKCDISSSSTRVDDYIHRGRGKRKQKPKVHFDELAMPDKSIRKVRRMRIMRYLGLTAPAGSPFSQPRARSLH